MVIKKYLQGIAVVVFVMISAILIVMAAPPNINFVSPTSSDVTITVNYINISITLSESGTALLKWGSDSNISMIGAGTSFYYNKTSLPNGGPYSYIVYANDTTPGNWTSSGTRTVTVNVPASPPGLSNPNPSTPVNSIFGFSQIFNVTVDQTANVSWKIGGSEVQNLSVSAGTKSEYTSNASQAIGSYSVTATAYNSTGTSTPVTWTWNVLPSQGPPPVSDVTYTKGTTWINWTWTNPTTGNFNYTTVKINNTVQPNTSNNYYNFTKFSPSTTNTIKLQTVDTSGNVNSTIISKSATTFNTPSGPNVNVNLSSNVKLNFTQVITEGDTTVTVSSINSWGNHSFQKVGNYYNITTNATYSGNINVELLYNPNGINESSIKLYHWNGSWVDVTTSLDKVNNKVKGTVTSLSPFVAGVPPVPTITKELPNTGLIVETIGNQPATFKVHTDQTTNIIWKLDGVQKQDNGTLAPGVTATYNVSADKGPHNVTVIATNTTTFASSIAYWNLSVRSTTYHTGNRIWDGSKPDDFGLTYSWTPQSFSGFYYNAKDDVGTENMTMTLGSYTSRSIATDNLVYSTSPQEVTFTHSGWGKYQVIGFMADKYFAGYTANTSSTNTRPTTDFSGLSALSQGGLHRVLIDDDTKRTISVGGTLALQDGYVLKATDIDLNARTMLLSIQKDGNEVDVSPLSAGETYVYTKTVGGVENLPLIMVRFDSVFSGQELQVAFIKGLFQITEDATTVHVGDRFGNMEINSVSKSGIEMSNRANIGLSKGSTADIMGNLKIKVADNDSAVRFALTVDNPSNLEVRSTVYRDSDTPPIMEWTPYNFGMEVGDTSVGFYYNLDDGVGSEDLKLDKKVSGRTIPEGGLEYSTKPQEVPFTYTGFGKYQAIGFMADNYFAGYTSNTGKSGSGVPIVTRPTTDFEGISTIANGNLHKVLIDDDTKLTIAVGSTISLQEGYVLKATDIDLNARAMLLTLLKDGNEVDVSPLSAGETYVYTKTVGGTESLPLIMVRFESVFSGQELQVAFLRGMFQISEDPTTIRVGDQFGSMEVSSISRDSITMSNSNSIGLSKNSNNALMGNIRLKVADNDALRFYFAVDVTPEMIANQLTIDAPPKVMAGDNIKIKVTAGGNAMDNASVVLNTDIGTTNMDGILNYTIPKNLQGTYNITATKLGYDTATKNIEIEKYVDYRLSLEAPSLANQYETITIKVLYNGTAMSGADVIFDNMSIGTSDSNGEVKYTLETSGTHTITASKRTYITVSRDIEIRAPYSEYKALDINITPNPGFAGKEFLVRSNITNAGTKKDTLPVELIINGSAVDNRSVTLGAGEKVEVNFTWTEDKASNVTVAILGQSMLYEVKENPTNWLLIGAIITGIGAVVIYVLTSKGILSMELLKQKYELLIQKFNLLFKK